MVPGMTKNSQAQPSHFQQVDQEKKKNTANQDCFSRSDFDAKPKKQINLNVVYQNENSFKENINLSNCNIVANQTSKGTTDLKQNH